MTTYAGFCDTSRGKNIKLIAFLVTGCTSMYLAYKLKYVHKTLYCRKTTFYSSKIKRTAKVIQTSLPHNNCWSRSNKDEKTKPPAARSYQHA